MERFNIRIALHGALPSVHDHLTAAMTRLGAAVFVETASGRMRRLPAGEFELRSEQDAQRVLRGIQTLVQPLWGNAAIRVTGERESCWSGTVPVPEHPYEHGAPSRPQSPAV